MAHKAKYLIVLFVVLLAVNHQVSAQTATPTPHPTPTPMTPPSVEYDAGAITGGVVAFVRSVSPAVQLLLGVAVALVVLRWSLSALKRVSS